MLTDLTQSILSEQSLVADPREKFETENPEEKADRIMAKLIRENIRILNSPPPELEKFFFEFYDENTGEYIIPVDIRVGEKGVYFFVPPISEVNKGWYYVRAKSLVPGNHSFVNEISLRDFYEDILQNLGENPQTFLSGNQKGAPSLTQEGTLPGIGPYFLLRVSKTSDNQYNFVLESQAPLTTDQKVKLRKILERLKKQGINISKIIEPEKTQANKRISYQPEALGEARANIHVSHDSFFLKNGVFVFSYHQDNSDTVRFSFVELGPSTWQETPIFAIASQEKSFAPDSVVVLFNYSRNCPRHNSLLAYYLLKKALGAESKKNRRSIYDETDDLLGKNMVNIGESGEFEVSLNYSSNQVREALNELVIKIPTGAGELQCVIWYLKTSQKLQIELFTLATNDQEIKNHAQSILQKIAQEIKDFWFSPDNQVETYDRITYVDSFDKIFSLG